jgi:hypothetical protein
MEQDCATRARSSSRIPPLSTELPKILCHFRPAGRSSHHVIAFFSVFSITFVRGSIPLRVGCKNSPDHDTAHGCKDSPDHDTQHLSLRLNTFRLFGSVQ